MTVALLDVNVLIALVDATHVDHDRAEAWFGEQADSGWATCPITENGTVRVVSSPAYRAAVSVSEARRVLAETRSVGAHRFWPCDVSLLDDSVIAGDRLHGSKQITDAYLVALAVARQAVFATFDRSIARSAVVGAAADSVLVL